MTAAARARALLRPGETIGVVAPGFGVKASALRSGVDRLRRMGYSVRVGGHVLDREGYLAGTDEARAADLNAMIESPEVRAVWFARGGYGSARLLPRVRWKSLAADPKPLIGYSDVTALFAAAWRRARCPCLHGPVVCELGDPRAYHPASLAGALRGGRVALRFGARSVLRPGRAAGPLLGGNLTVLAHLLGTPWAPDLRGALLFVEDVGEPAYRIDRALQHLLQSGVLDGVRGVLVGCLEAAARRSFLRDRQVPELLRETFGSLGVPVVVGLPAGHLPAKWTLPLGGAARLDTARGRLDLRSGP